MTPAITALYLDTSALLKAFVSEDGTAEVRAWMRMAEVHVSSAIAALETASALARLRREGGSGSATGQAWKAFEEAWKDCAQVQVDEVLAEAARLIASHPLRSLDAIHLASALRIQGSGHSIHFACFDDRLRAAALEEGLEILPPMK